MAGKIETYIAPSLAFERKPAQYHDKSMSAKTTVNIMEEYLWNQFDEGMLLDLLSTEVKRGEALQYLDQHLHENSILVFKDKQALFRGFSSALSDPNQKVCTQCTKLIAKLIPQLGKDLDTHMYKLLTKIVNNVGSQSVTLQKESIQTLHVYMKHSMDVFQILHVIAHVGIQHEDARIRHQIIHTFPTLLFNEFKTEDFFDIVNSLFVNLADDKIERDVILQTISKVKEFIGKDAFEDYVRQLSAQLQNVYQKLTTGIDQTSNSKTIPQNSFQAKHSDFSQDEFTFPPRASAALVDRLSDEQTVNSFSKSGRFAAPGRRRQNKDVYSSMSTTLPSYDTPSSISVKQSLPTNDKSHYTDIAFIPKSIIERLSSTEVSVRLQAVVDLKGTIDELQDFSLLKQNIIPLISILQPMVDDKNFRVACSALQACNGVISKIGPALKSYLKLFIYAVAKKLGHSKDVVRSECMKIILHTMEIVDPQIVLDLFWQKAKHKQGKVREDFVNLLIASLLKFCLIADNNVKPVDLEKLCAHIAPLLLDPKASVRQATLDCFAVVGHLLGPGPGSIRPISNAINEVELQHDNATGIMSAVHARLVRKQLPRLNENMLVEYAVFPPSTAPVTSPQGADLRWILATDTSKHCVSAQSLYSVQDNEVKRSVMHSKKVSENIAPDMDTQSHQPLPRRYVSAGKQRQFPWVNQEDEVGGSKHPSSAPVNSVKTQHTTEKRPPFPIRNTWGPESELSPRFHHVIRKSENEAADNGPSYQELHKRKKEAKASKSSLSSGLSAGSAGSDSGYMPSFASSGYSASVSSTPSGAQVVGPGALSSSCPSAFFEKNPVSRPPFNRRRTQKKDDLNISSSSAYGTEPEVPLSESPFIQKPTLARSASKRRDLALRDSIKPDDLMDKVPGKLKNTSASPRFDRLVSNISVDQMRPMLRQSNISSTASEKFRGPLFSDKLEKGNDTGLSHGGYTPSSMQKQPGRDAMKIENIQRNVLAYDKYIDPSSKADQPLVDSDLLRNANNRSSDDAKHAGAHTIARPIVSSSFSPARHRKSSTELKDNPDQIQDQVSAIRRSAQNRRDRMRSQPTSEDSFDASSEFTNSSRSTKAQSANKNSDMSSLSPVISNDNISSPSKTETPSFKYNPNMGVTFDPKNADSSVSVVGVKLGYSPGGSSDVKVTLPSPISTPSSVSITSIGGVGNRYSPNNAGHDRYRQHRASSLGMASSTASPDSGNASFNVQGKGVFMAPSTTSILTTYDGADPTATLTRDEFSSLQNNVLPADSTKLMDGVCGIAVLQQNPVDEFPSQMSLRQPSETEVSLAASLRQKQFEKKEVTRAVNQSSRNTFSPGSDLEVLPQPRRKNEKQEEILNQSMDRRFRKTSPLNVSGTSQRAGPVKDQGPKTTLAKSSAGSFHSTASINPLDSPERGLSEAIASIEMADSEEWEIVTQGMFLLRRLAHHHPNVLATRFRDVIALLSKNVLNLRSQVSRASVITLADLYNNLKKPTVDVDIETVVRALLTENGKNNSFIKNEISKTLQCIVTNVTSSKILNALLNTGLRHLNKKVRNSTAKFCAELVDKMGPGKALSGVKDTTDRLLDAVAAFIGDSSPEVRYYGRYIVNELMIHEDFDQSVDRFLSSKSAQELKECASTIKQRGLGSNSSIGNRKLGGSIRKRNGSASSSNTHRVTEQSSLSSSSSAQSRRRTMGTKVFNETEQEDLKHLCNELDRGNLVERKSGVSSLLRKLQEDRRFVDDNLAKVMDSFLSLLTTANTKFNQVGLEALPVLLRELGDSLRDVLPSLVRAVFKLVLSKSHGELAQRNVDAIIQYIDPVLLLQPIANIAQFSNARAKQLAVQKLIKLIDNVTRRKVQAIERYVLPVLRELLSAHNIPGGVQLRKETAQLTMSLHNLLGQRLLEFAETNNLLSRVEEMLDG